MGNEVITQEAALALRRSVDAPAFLEQVSLALPESVPPRRFVRATITALMANPELALSDHASVLNALMRAAQDGLVPDGHEAAITIYHDNKRNTDVAQYLPMIGGIRKIAAEHGWSIETRVVYDGDTFVHEEGLEPKLEHVPKSSADRSKRVAVYAIGRHRDGRRQHEVLYPDDVARARKSSKMASRGPWVEHESRMWEKTAGHALAKRLAMDPNDVRVRRVLELEPGDAVDRLYGPPAATVPARAPVAGELVAGSTTPAQGTPADAGAQEAAGAPQAAAPPAATEAAAAPGEDDEPVVDLGPQDEPESGEQLEARLEAARAVTFTRGANEGKALGDVAQAVGAMTWFGWALNNLHTFDDELAASVRLVAEHDVPEAWAKHVAKVGA